MIWRHLFGYLPANLASALTSFGAVYAFTRLLGADEYGHYALLAAIMHMGHTSLLTWSEASAYRFAGRAAEEGDMASHLRTSLGLSILSSIPVLLLTLIGWLTITDPTTRAALFALGVSMPAMSIVQIGLEMRRARQEVKRYAMVAMTRTLATFFLGVLLAWTVWPNASAPFWGMAISAIIVCFWEGSAVIRLSKGGQFDWDRAKRYFAYGAPVALALLLEIALSSGDRFMIAYFINNEAVGAYAAGYGVADQTIRMLCMWGAMAGAPLVMAAYERNGPDGVKEPGAAMAKMLMLVALPAAAGIALVARPLAEFMIGVELREQAIHIIPWISLAGLLNGLVIYYFSESFQLSSRTGLRALLMLAPAILNVVLNVILLPRVGVMGAVYATVACYAFALVLVAGVGRRFVPLPIPAFDLAKVMIACLAMWVTVRFVPAFGALPEVMLKAGVGALTFAMAAWAINAAGARELINSGIGRIAPKLMSRVSA